MARFDSFVGRELELAALSAIRKETAQGPRFVLLGGEAGVGKSRLLTEFRRRLPRRPTNFGLGECSDVAPAPFAPFIAMFTEMAPEIARLLTDAPPTAVHGEAAVRTLFENVRHALEALAAKRAVLLYLEDLHEADSGTLALLAHLARGCRARHMLMVVTYRAEALDRSDELVATIARLMRLPNVAAVDLFAFAERDARILALGSIQASLAGKTHLVDVLVARADGNPFFIEELVKHAAAHGGAETVALPRSISAAIRERLGALPEYDRALLEQAAVLGRTFHVEVLRRVSAADRDDLLAALRRARHAGLVVEEPSDAQRLRFRHALTREAIVGELLALQRQSLHARIVTELESLPAAERVAYATELAYHAHEAHDAGKSVLYGEAAGDGAVALHAYMDAASHYSRAINAGELSHETRRRLVRKLADCLSWSRSAYDARRAYDEALDLARAAGDADDAGTIQMQTAYQHYVHGNTSEAIASATSALETLSAGGSEELRDVAAAKLALYHVFRLETADALRVLATIERPDAPSVAATYHQVRSSAFAIRLELEAWKNEAALYLAAAERGGHVELCGALHNVADCAVATGEMRLAEQWLRRSMAMANSETIERYFVFVAGGLSYQRFLAGDLTEARRLAESALSHGGWAMSDGTPTATAIWTGLALGDRASADAAYNEELVEIALASRQSQNFGNLAGASAELLAERGRLREARSLLRRALERIEHPYLCETFLFVAARYAAEADLPRVIEIAAHPSRPRSHPLCAATISFVDALVDVRRGRENEARENGSAAAAHFGSLGWKPFEAEALEIAGQVGPAMEIYRGMRHVRALRRLAAGEVRTPAAGPGRAGLLSPREREIAALVATGKPNRVIAQTLGIADKTVEQHLSSAFGKLEVSSRGQLVAALSEETPYPHDCAT